MRGGMVMLEVILGVAILGMAGVGLITLLSQTLHTVRLGRDAEQRTASAARQLDRASVWSENELAGRLGRSRAGTWTLEVTTARAKVYTLAVLDTLTGATVLRTTLYRP